MAEIVETRRAEDEDERAYGRRMREALEASGAQVAWICLAPGRHVPLLAEIAVEAGLHVIAEKPWVYPREQTEHVRALARVRERVVGVHFEYCFLDSVVAWRRELAGGAGLVFGGRFHVGVPDRFGVSALENLGCHLVAIREHAVPAAALGRLDCRYEAPRAAEVWLHGGAKGPRAIDFTESSEPIIQRFLAAFEAALPNREFEFDLAFAQRVGEALRELEAS